MNHKEIKNKGLADFNIVTSRLKSLLEKGVINEDELSHDLVDYEGEKIPKVIVTIQKLGENGYLKDIEDSVHNFCYITGMGEGLIKKDDK